MKKIILFLLVVLFYSGKAQTFQKSVLENPNSFENILLENAWGKKIFIGYSAKGNPVYGYYYNKGGTDKAMILGGVHGSEFYGSYLADSLKASLDKMKVKNYKWKVLIIPRLFVDNIIEGEKCLFEINCFRRTCDKCPDPNRQMTKAGLEYKIGDTLSFLNEKIEIENQYLLHITQTFNPSRIASLHCKNGPTSWRTSEDLKAKGEQIGIYADPRTDGDNIALGFSEDALLTMKMAFIVKENGGIINGNFIENSEISHLNPVYPQDPPFAQKNQRQERSYNKADKEGVSFGTWASTEIKKDNKLIKKAATIFTIELPQYYSFFNTKDDIGSLDKASLNQNSNAYLKALREVFLELN